MRYFARLNGEDVVGLVRFDKDTMMTSDFRKSTQEWVDDLEDMDIVTGRNHDAREVDEAEADRIRTEVLGGKPAGFTATDSSGQKLRWLDGVLSGEPDLVDHVKALIASGEHVHTIVGGPLPQAGAAPGWVAWFTARAALEPDPDSDALTWEGEVEFPDEWFGHPPGSVP